MSQKIFYRFVAEMSEILNNSTFNYDDQKKLLKKLFAVEKKFKDTLLSTPNGRNVYKSFMKFILNDQKNILAARIYFRERQDTFSNKIAKAFHQNKPEKLFKFRINYVFAVWACKNIKRKNKKLLRLLEDMKTLRNNLCEMNLPLAINRSKIFWSKIPDSHLEYMDLIQTSSEGLLIAIDKFVPPFKLVFRSVAIGRMVAYMIEDNSETIIKLSPTERRILYLINKAKNTEKAENEDEILKFVKKSFPNVTKEHLNELMNASKTVNIDISANKNESDKDSMQKKEADIFFKSSNNLEEDIVNNDLKRKLVPATKNLSVLEKKVLSLTYGINFLKE
jgi:DNA-directed RNA polymerase specialized sigma subunit